MKINRVTITGADNKINQSDLLLLQEKYPFVEWGILFSTNKDGQPRYPSRVHRIVEFDESALQLSAHFCGFYSREVLEKGNFMLIQLLPFSYKRVQLNYNFKNNKGRFNLVSLLRFVERNKERDIILQYNDSNAEIIEKFRVNGLPDNINFLYDSSGGRGKLLNDIKNPFKQYTGYSGGISPDNVEGICRYIQNHESSSNVWIDMENGVRTDNQFDLVKVSSVLRRCEPFILK